MKKIQFIMLFFVLALGMSSCKYEEGPFISVIPKTERVTNTWIVSNAIIDGTQSSSIPSFKQITFYKEGDLNVVFTVLGVDVPYSGTWEFSDDKAAIVFTSKDEASGFFSYDRTWTILKLKEELLKVTWVEPTTSTDEVYTVEFVPAE
jgi:hypothetical protein